jgi:hypothetical protein
VQAAKDPNYENGPINTDELIGSMVTISVDKQLNQDGTESKYLMVTGIEKADVSVMDDFSPNFDEA